MIQEVGFLKTVYKKKTSYSPDHYQLRTDKKHLWLQKLAIWVLRKLGCFAIITTNDVVRHTFDTRKLVDKIMIQQAELAALYHYKGSHLLMGHEEFNEIYNLEINHPLSIAAQYMWQEPRPTPDNPYDMIRTKNQLRITIVPWMKGVLVLPKDFKEND